MHHFKKQTMTFKKTLTVIIFSFFAISAFATDYYTATTRLNVRNGAGTSYSVLFSINKGDEVELISKDNNWYEIKYKEKTGFASSKYLKFSRTETSTNQNTSIKTDDNTTIWVSGFIILLIILIILIVNSGSKKSSTEIKGTQSIPNQNLNQPRVIVTKSTKSVGIAVLLVIIFGPLGMFYSTIGGAILMTILAPIILVTLLLTGNWGSLILLAILYYPICMIWAGNAASNYNQKIIKQVQNS
ncbi:MAG: SH3 domain-containing protein [Flavobacterium sp.]